MPCSIWSSDSYHFVTCKSDNEILTFLNLVEYLQIKRKTICDDDRDAGPGGYRSAQDPGSSIRLAHPAEDLAGIVDAEQVVIPRASIRVAVDYPLADEHVFALNSGDSAGFRRGELALKITQLYQRIYAEEERSSAEPAGTIPGLYNRTRTEGTYGIWGHGLGDLVLVDVYHQPDRDVWGLSVDS